MHLILDAGQSELPVREGKRRKHPIRLLTITVNGKTHAVCVPLDMVEEVGDVANTAP